MPSKTQLLAAILALADVITGIPDPAPVGFEQRIPQVIIPA